MNSQIANPESHNPIVEAALEVITSALAKAKKPCITSSFQAECVVLTHMLLQERPDIPVLFLDTVHHFAETYTYRDQLAERWGLNLVNLRAADPSLIARAARSGSRS